MLVEKVQAFAHEQHQQQHATHEDVTKESFSVKMKAFAHEQHQHQHTSSRSVALDNPPSPPNLEPPGSPSSSPTNQPRGNRRSSVDLTDLQGKLDGLRSDTLSASVSKELAAAGISSPKAAEASYDTDGDRTEVIVETMEEQSRKANAAARRAKDKVAKLEALAKRI